MAVLVPVLYPLKDSDGNGGVADAAEDWKIDVSLNYPVQAIRQMEGSFPSPRGFPIQISRPPLEL